MVKKKKDLHIKLTSSSGRLLAQGHLYNCVQFSATPKSNIFQFSVILNFVSLIFI